MKDPGLYIIFILEGIERLERFCGSDVDAALEDEKTYHAIQRVLETISDATKYIPADIKENHPEIEWSKITSFRNVLAHDYLGISPAPIAGVLQVEIPLLKKVLQKIMKDK